MLPIKFEQALCIARQHSAAGRLSQAEGLCRRLLQDHPRCFDVLQLLSDALLRDGKPQQAIPFLQLASKENPTHARLQFDLGRAYAAIGQAQQATAAYEKAIELNPLLSEAHANLAVLYRSAGRLQDALGACERSLEMNPDSAEVLCNFGAVLAEVDRVAEALECYERALRLDPGFAKAYYNLGNARRKMGEPQRAVEAYRRAVALKPDLAQAWSNLGMALVELGEQHEALTAYDRAIALQPTWAQPRWNRALSHLLLGDFQRGWAEFDYRNKIEPPSSRPFPGPRWNGEDLRGKTILLHFEMGLGDAIQFVRYVPLIAQRAGRVILECPKTLHALFSSVDGVDQLVSLQREQCVLHYDAQCSLMRLPELFRSEPATIPRKIPYLRAPAERLDKWRTKLGERSNALRVGLVWAGNPTHQNDRHRSVGLSMLAPLAEVPGVEFISLQCGPPSLQIKDAPSEMTVVDSAGDFADMADTAAVIEQLDLVISVDTSVAHLAGALGKPVWVLLAFSPDWRWMLERGDSPWYPSMRLFRQKRLNDWEESLAEIKQALTQWRARSGENSGKRAAEDFSVVS